MISDHDLFVVNHKNTILCICALVHHLCMFAVKNVGDPYFSVTIIGPTCAAWCTPQVGGTALQMIPSKKSHVMIM